MKKLILLTVIAVLLLSFTACDKPQGHETQGTQPPAPTTESAEPHDHVYTSKQTKDPSCEEPGELVYTCECGHSYTEAVAALGHTWDNWITSTPSTFVTTGEATRECSVCKKTEAKELEKSTVEEELERIASRICTLPAYQSVDELNTIAVFNWLRLEAGTVSSDWNDKTYLVTNIYSLDKFDAVSQRFFGRVFDFKQFADNYDEFTIDTEKNHLIWVTGGAGGGYTGKMETFTQIDGSHYTVRYSANDFDGTVAYYGTLNLRLTDSGFVIESHTREK